MGVNLTSTEVLRRSPQWAFNTHRERGREREKERERKRGLLVDPI